MVLLNVHVNAMDLQEKYNILARQAQKQIIIHKASAHQILSTSSFDSCLLLHLLRDVSAGGMVVQKE